MYLLMPTWYSCSEHPILNTQRMLVKACGHYIHVLYTLFPPPCDMTEYKLETLLETRSIVSELTHTSPYTVHLKQIQPASMSYYSKGSVNCDYTGGMQQQHVHNTEALQHCLIINEATILYHYIHTFSAP